LGGTNGGFTGAGGAGKSTTEERDFTGAGFLAAGAFFAESAPSDEPSSAGALAADFRGAADFGDFTAGLADSVSGAGVDVGFFAAMAQR
jgi:hypothetical protein